MKIAFACMAALLLTACNPPAIQIGLNDWSCTKAHKESIPSGPNGMYTPNEKTICDQWTRL